MPVTIFLLACHRRNEYQHERNHERLNEDLGLHKFPFKAPREAMVFALPLFIKTFPGSLSNAAQAKKGQQE